jgi:hypothetical protein
VGGTWLTPPRSIEQCKASFGPFYLPTDCPETPRFIISDARPEGVPARIYVTDADPEIWMQTQLSATWCIDETGGDALGADELMVWMGQLQSIPAWDSLDDLEDQFGVYWDNDSDVNERKRPRKLMSTARVPLAKTNFTDVVLRVGEDDAFDWDHVAAGIVGSIAGAIGGGLLSGNYWVAAGAAVGGGIAGFSTAFLYLPNPDDEIGQAVWSATVDTVNQAGLLAHEGTISSGDAPVSGIDPQKLPDNSGIPNRFLKSRRAAKHPSVDTLGYNLNPDIQTCIFDSGCSPGKFCYEGACVPMGWTDGTLPKGNFDISRDVPGTMEIVHLDGDGEYLFYISTSISDERGL